KMLANAKKKQADATLDDVKKPFGASYRDMLQEVNGTLANLKTHFPGYAGQGYELAGFVWFQGWNDMINAEYTAEYTANLTHFIRDVRKDLKAPKLPFVIGQMGVDGVNPSAGVKRFKAAQAAVLAVSEFGGNPGRRRVSSGTGGGEERSRGTSTFPSGSPSARATRSWSRTITTTACRGSAPTASCWPASPSSPTRPASRRTAPAISTSATS